MANTYTQLLVQIVFAVKGRQCFINEKNREQIEKYICGIISNKQSKPLAIYCNPDHCHVLIGLHPSHSISDGKRHKSQFIKIHQRKSLDNRQIRMAGGLWCFYVFTIAT